jgi:LacI family transcriptional regulator
MGRRPSRDRSTIGDVATQAGVSRATVSRVMNGLATVDPRIAARVRATAVELDYRPNQVARSLALGRTQTIGYVVPDLTNPSFHGGLRGLSRAAARQGYRVLVADSAEHAEDEPLLALETRRRCDAVVLVAPRMPDEALARLLPDLQPAVLLNRRIEGAGLPQLDVDWASGIRDLVRHLTGLGHRRITYLQGPAASRSNAARERALDAATDVEVVKIACGAMFHDGHAAAGRVLDAGVTAVVAFNDVAALGLLGALHELGTDVPRELSVVGFDDIPFAAYTWPPLTTAWVPQEQMGELAWERLSALLSPIGTADAPGSATTLTAPGSRPDVPPGGGASDDRMLMRPRLVVRGSTGRAPATA